jgi:hypothetical protein
LPEGPLKSRTVVMRDERVGRCPAVSGLTQPWLEHCLFYSPEFANLEEDTRNRVNTVSQSGGMTGVPKPSLDVSVSQKGRTRRAGLQNVGKHCSGTGRNLFGSALNLDRAGVQSPDTPGLTGHVQTVLVTCRHVLGRGRGCPQGGNAPSSHYLESSCTFGNSCLTALRGPPRPPWPLSRNSFPHAHRLQSRGSS